MSEQWKSITGIEELEQRASGAPQSVNPSPQFAQAVPLATPVIQQTPAAISQAPTGASAQLPAGQRCAFCSSLFAGEYYRVGGQAACGNCAADAKLGLVKDNQTAYFTSLLLGAVAAFAGLIFYSGFTIITHFYIGYVALAVGWLIGSAMMFGSKGIGGLRYQVTAVLLTYFAISLSAVPIALAHSSQQLENPVLTIPVLILLGIASPLLELASPIHGLIGLVILFVGIRIAFRLTRSKPLTVNGPYSIAG
jgi:hypothetical protein